MKNTTLPTVLADRMLASWHDIQWGEMVIHLECLFSAPLDEQRLARAIYLALDSEPVLGCRFVSDEKRTWWERIPDDQRKPLLFTTDPSQYQAFATAPFDVRQDQGLQAVLLRQTSGDCLLFRVSHLVADAAGTREVVATVAYIYRRLKSHPDWIPEPNEKGQRGLAQLFRRISFKERWRILKSLIRLSWHHRTPVKRVELPVVQPSGYCWVVRHLDAVRVAKMAAWGKQRNATLNDLFLAAFLRAVSVSDRVGSRHSNRLRMTVDLRRYLPDKATGGPCNFSAFEYVDVGSEPFASYPEAVARVVACTSLRKNDWIGMSDLILAPLLRRLGYPRLCRLFQRVQDWGIRKRNAPNTLTNMGVITPQVVDFGMRPSAAYLLVPVVFPPLLGAGVSGYDGSITFSIGVPGEVRSQVEHLLDLALADLPAPPEPKCAPTASQPYPFAPPPEVKLGGVPKPPDWFPRT